MRYNSRMNENTIYSLSAREPDDKYEMDLLKARCKKEGLNFSQVIIKLVRSYNADVKRRVKN